jgi:hypothetical protein
MTKVRTLLEIKELLDDYKQQVKDCPSTRHHYGLLCGILTGIYKTVDILACNDGYQKLSNEKLTDYVDRFFEEAS